MRWTVLFLILFACSSKGKPEAVNIDHAAEVSSGEAKLTGSQESMSTSTQQMVLFSALATDGESRLFALAPAGAEARVVAFGSAFSIKPGSAQTSADGTTLAMFGSLNGGPVKLYRAHLNGEATLEEVQVPELETAFVAAVSDDGTVIAVKSGDELSVIREGRIREITNKRSGKFTYGVALSRDGTRLAYSTMKTSCAYNIDKMQTCPVTLFAVDLATNAGPRKLAGGDDSVAYDPQFTSADADTLWFMSNAGDTSEGCRKTVNQCAYEVREIEFSGEASTQKIGSALLARRAPDGTPSYRRAVGKFDASKLVIGEHVVAESSSIWLHHWSPDSQFVAALLHIDGTRTLAILGRDAKQKLPGIPGKDVRLIGWSRAKVKTTTGELAEPSENVALRRALDLARSLSKAGTKIAVAGGGTSSHQAVAPDADRLKGSWQIETWLKQEPAGLVIDSSAGLCRLRARLPAANAVGMTTEHIIIGLGNEPASKAGATTETVLATFRFKSGEVSELVSVGLPETAKPGSNISLTLGFRGTPAPFWQVFVHFDGQGRRLQGDHKPPLCEADWRDDRSSPYTIEIPVPKRAAHGTYDVYVGWFFATERAGERFKIGTIEIKD